MAEISSDAEKDIVCSSVKEVVMGSDEERLVETVRVEVSVNVNCVTRIVRALFCVTKKVQSLQE